LKQNDQHKIIAAIVTLLVLALTWLLLWFIYLDAPQNEEDEGLMISFGDVQETGGGVPTAAPYVPSEPVEATAPAAKAEPALTQEDESAMRAAEEARKREAEEARKRAEQERKQQEAITKAQQMGALFGNTPSPEGANGQPGDNGNAKNGNPLGHGSAGGNDWSLDGRRLVGELPKPAATFNQEGKVVVWITVDKAGNVVSARAGKGTTVSDEATCQLAVKAALKAKFDMVDHPNAALGTITYYFKNK